MSRAIPLLVLALAVAGGCAPAPPLSRVYAPVPRVPDLPPLLTWIGEFTRPAGTIYPQLTDSVRFGSLSGLVFDARSGEWVAAIDERERSRVAWVSINFTAGQLEVSPLRMTALRAAKGVPDRIATESDLEAIAALPDGSFMLVEEGHRKANGEIWQPALLHMTRDGIVTRVFGFPEPFRITGDGKRGVRENQGFESLTRTPAGRVITGLEQPLIENGSTTFDRPGEGRLVEFEPRGRDWRPGRQWRYEISPTPKIEGFPELCSDGENGLVELLATSDTTLISMERACLREAAGANAINAVRLFAVELTANEAKKTLLLDLSDLLPRLSADLVRLENFEALAFGPLISGARSLLVVSDDNFRATQRTSFLLFGLRY